MDTVPVEDVVSEAVHDSVPVTVGDCDIDVETLCVAVRLED